MKPYYQDKWVTIYHGDCREILPQLDVKVDLVPTSPPYNVGMGYEGYNDNISWDDYKGLAAEVSNALFGVLSKDRRLWLNVVPIVPLNIRQANSHSGRCYAERISLLNIWETALISTGLKIWDIVSWQSPRGYGTAWGSWETPSAPNLRGDWEAILVTYKGTWGRTTPDAFKNWKDGLGGWQNMVTNVWRLNTTPNENHPAVFPEELAERIIRLSTFPNELILDPFLGSGTTCYCAKKLNRYAIGIEIEEKYCEIAARRCCQEVMDFSQ